MNIVNPVDLDLIRLATGAHAEDPEARVGCVMEWTSYLAGEPWSDHPQCVSPVIAAFCISWNDSIRDDATRDRLLKPFLTKVIGTRTTGEDERTRSWMATDWLARVQAPAWLRLAGLIDDADALAACGEITDAKSAKAAQQALNRARTNAWDAARGAAGDAARAAAWDAAWAAAWAAARAAARAAAWDAAGAAAGAAARDAAWAAARDAAWAAAGDVLAPTVAELQTSAADLLDRMCAVGRK